MSDQLVRGACPGVARPMATGDGLLARLPPLAAPLAPATLAGIAAAAEEYGNGIVEITRRGSIQVRGLSAAVVAAFGDALATLGLDLRERVPVYSSPLDGLDASAADLRPLVGDLREALADQSLAGRLAPKLSVLVDGGGHLHLDTLAADIRVVATGEGRCRVELAGDARDARPLADLAPPDIVPVVLGLLRRVAAEGPATRVHDLLRRDGVTSLRRALGLPPSDPTPRAARAVAEPLGVHALGRGLLAVGVAPAFGHMRAAYLGALVEIAAAEGATAFVPASPRALLAIGLSSAGAEKMQGAAARLGFITRAGDPRRFVAACAGAPACRSAHMTTRALAPALAAALAPVLDGSIEVHLSGCAKGCAHPETAALTIVGAASGCGLVVGGRAHDAPLAEQSVELLAVNFRRFGAQLAADRRPGESTAGLFARMATPALVTELMGEAADA